MTIEHSTITDPDVHEPKGITTANAKEIYVADGLGSGSWRYPDYSMTYTIADASLAGPDTYYITIPFTGSLIAAYAIVDDTFSMDQTIDFKVAGVTMTGGTIALLSGGSAAGNIYSCTPTALNTISAGGALQIVNTGGSASPFSLTITLIFEPS